MYIQKDWIRALQKGFHLKESELKSAEGGAPFNGPQKLSRGKSSRVIVTGVQGLLVPRWSLRKEKRKEKKEVLVGKAGEKRRGRRCA